MDGAYVIGAVIGALFAAVLLAVLLYRRRRGKLQRIRWLSLLALSALVGLIAAIAASYWTSENDLAAFDEEIGAIIKQALQEGGESAPQPLP